MSTATATRAIRLLEPATDVAQPARLQPAGPRLLPVPDCEPPLQRLVSASNGPALRLVADVPVGSEQRAGAARTRLRLVPDLPRTADERPVIDAATKTYRRWAPTANRHGAGGPGNSATVNSATGRSITGNSATVKSTTASTRTLSSAPSLRRQATVGTTTAQRRAALPARVVTASGSLTDTHDFDDEPTNLADIPSPLSAAEKQARAILAVLGGQRHQVRLQDGCSKAVLAGLDDFPTLRTPARLVSQWVCQPTAYIAEVATTFQADGRIRALAMRMQAHRGEWHVTAVQLA